MEIAVRREPSLVIVDLAGEIDVNAVSRIRDSLGDLTKTRSAQILVNLSRATYIDSSGLGILMAARKDTLQGGGRFVLCGMITRTCGWSLTSLVSTNSSRSTTTSRPPAPVSTRSL